MKLIATFFFILLSSYVNGQSADIIDFVTYFDQKKDLDPIEGIWSVNVFRKLYYRDSLLLQENEEVISEWAIVKENALQYKVKDINRRGNYDKEVFFATFERTSFPNLYTYHCDFNLPEWSATANAFMVEEQIIEYSYWASEVYMKHTYKDSYMPGLKLHWDFIWVKKYPIQDNQNQPWKH
jgi:hypothetical protein